MINLSNSFDLNISLSEMLSSLPQELNSEILSLINILKIGGLLFIAYLILMIISKLMNLRDSSNLSSISKNTLETNKKLDCIISSFGQEKNKKDKKSNKK